jgi:hypothetical protein
MAHRGGRLGQGDHVAPGGIDHDSIDIVAGAGTAIDVVAAVARVSAKICGVSPRR